MPGFWLVFYDFWVAFGWFGWFLVGLGGFWLVWVGFGWFGWFLVGLGGFWLVWVVFGWFRILAVTQDDISGIKYIIIDEYSVIGQKLSGWIDRHCKQATSCETSPFGGISIILVGDIAQLPPVTDKVVYHNKPSGNLGTAGFCAYRQLIKVIRLTVNEMAKGSDSVREDLRNLQITIRDGNCSVDQWNLLLTRTPNNVNNLDSFKADTVKLSFGNDKVAQYNYEQLKNLKKPIATINAKHNNATAAKLSTDDLGSLMPQLLLCEGAKVMLTRNLWTDAGLCNGAIGTVKHIVHTNDGLPPGLPVAVIVQFDDSYIRPSISKISQDVYLLFQF